MSHHSLPYLCPINHSKYEAASLLYIQAASLKMMMKAFESALAMSTGRTCTSFPTSTPQWKYVVFPSFQGDHTRKHFTASRTSFPSSTPQWKYEKRFRASCSSSSPSNRQWKYDVFLSFRGDDTWKRFTDHLYTALESHGIITFKDDPELQKGKPISPELFSAIEESKFALILLSENYASSTWCLDELLQILEFMEARETVLPIFYNVDPSDVRKQTGSFTQAFIKHEENFKDDKKKVQRWRYGLTKVANFSGWDSKDWSESKLVKDIVELVWKRLRPTLLSLVDDFVGIDSRLKPIINLCLDARCLHMHTELEFSFTFIGTVMKMCGVRVVYEEDAEAFIK
ncbi:hypothetical protein PRUPE_3G169500 [Prunus persica]|uniref:TIR domain-containing protein n=1 Tax=Prunus persica TaxID=3760 RepID=A0A251Q2I1_PRUPE|nr:hypothetical protein PRUPE_3G169500 [Prunus persica]